MLGLKFYKLNIVQKKQDIKAYIFLSHDKKEVVVPVVSMDKIYRHSGYFPESLSPLYENPDDLLSVIQTPFSFSALLFMSSVYNNIIIKIDPSTLSHAEADLIDWIFNIRNIYQFNKTGIPNGNNEYKNMVDKFLSFGNLDPNVIITRSIK